MVRMINPFAVGYPQQGSINRQDGYISALQLFIFLVCLLVSVMLAELLTEHHRPFFVNRWVTEIFLIGYMVVSMVIMYLLQRPLREDYVFLDEDPSNSRSFFKMIASIVREIDDLPVLGILVFYVMGVPLDFAIMSSHFQCLGIFYECGVVAYYVGHIIFHVIRLFFMGFGLVFCLSFHHCVMRRSLVVHYGLVVLMSTALGLWLDDSLSESFPDQAPTNNTNHYEVNITCTGPHMTVEDEQCLSGNTPLYMSTTKIAQYLYPPNIEFMLIFTEIIFHLFLGAVNQNEFDNLKISQADQGDNEDSQDENARNLNIQNGDNSSTTSKDSTDKNDTTDESAPDMLRTSNDQHPLLNNIEVSSVSVIRLPCHRYTLLWMAVVIAINLLLTFNRFFIFTEVGHWYGWMVNTVHYSADIGVCLLGLWVCAHFECPLPNYRGFEIVSIFSMSGVIMYSVLMIIAVSSLLLHPIDQPEEFNTAQLWFISLQSILLAILLYMQTTLLMHNLNVNINKSHAQLPFQDNSDPPGNSDIRWERKQYMFLHINLYLSVFNFGMWFTDTFSFLLTANHTLWFPVENYFYSEEQWEHILHVLKPLILFYHYSCAILFLKIFLINLKLLMRQNH